MKLKKVLFLISTILVLFIACKKTENDKLLPKVIIINITNIQENSVTIKCNAIFEGGQAIIAKGVCWSTDSTKRILNNTNEGADKGLYTSNIIGLNKSTKYFVK